MGWEHSRGFGGTGCRLARARGGSGGSGRGVRGRWGKLLELSPNSALYRSLFYLVSKPVSLSLASFFLSFLFFCLSDCLNLVISPSIILSLSLSLLHSLSLSSFSHHSHSSSTCLPFLTCFCVSVRVSHVTTFNIFTPFFVSSSSPQTLLS